MLDRVPLPAETIVGILVWLGPLDIVGCRLDIIDSSPDLQFLLELHSFGYTASPSPRFDIPCKDRAALFRQFRRNWTSESATPVDKYNLEPVDFGTTYKFCNGVYARGSSLPGRVRTYRLDLCQLPSVIKGTRWKQWSHPDLGLELDDFAIEPDYDLLVLLRATTSEPLSDTGEPPRNRTRPDVEQAFTIHLRSLETNLPHSVATHTELKRTVPGLADEAWSFQSQVVGNYLAVMFLHTSTNAISYLVVWDWVIGQEVTHIDSGLSSGGSVASSFTFLSDRLILVPSCLVPSKLDQSSDSFVSNQGKLDIYTFEELMGDASAKPARRLVSLLLPAILPRHLDVCIEDISCRCDPAPLVSPQLGAHLCRHPRAFQLAPEKRVACLTITLVLILNAATNTFWEEQSDLCIPVSDLLSVVSRLPDQAGSIPYIRWENWAEYASFVDTGALYSSGNKQHGQRSVYTGGGINQPGEDLSQHVTGLSLAILSFDSNHVQHKLSSEMKLATFNSVTDGVLGGSISIGREYFRQAYIDEEHKVNKPFIARTTPINDVISPGYKLMIDDEHGES